MRPRKSTRLVDTRYGTEGDDQGEIPSPIPENWQQIMAEMLVFIDQIRDYAQRNNNQIVRLIP